MRRMTDNSGFSRLLNRYCDEIERFNPAYGLVKVKDREELFSRHIYDSLAPLEIIRKRLAPFAAAGTARLADAGSGAGLPGIPLAIFMPEVQVTLIERMGRRAGFLLNTIAVLGLSNVEIEEAGIEDAAPGRFHGVVFRAFRPLAPDMLKGLFRLLVPADAEGNCGFLAAYKGRREKIETELALAGLPAERWELHPLPVPGPCGERHLVIINNLCPIQG
jgi:16S rRNA (guanine527-N7)-methyltransferase